jgi:adenine deaminase
MKAEIKGNLVDIHSESIYPVELFLEGGVIKKIVRLEQNQNTFILPGFVDAHIHIESSLLTPENFAPIALRHGTIATVSDPHEIANVCGLEGVDFMIRSGERAALRFFWTAPSCVPATSFETSGAIIAADDLKKLFANDKVVALGEMMNYPGVIFGDPTVWDKCKTTLESLRVIDGHAPGLTGKDLKAYVSAGITTDHECSTLEEAKEKLGLGLKILIREGSSAKNFEALCSLLNTNPDEVMLCSDDLHADDLLKGHLDLLIKKALHKKISLFNVLKAVSLNPVQHYKLPLGLLREGDSADFVVVDSLSDFNILETWIGGNVVSEKDKSEYPSAGSHINNFNASFLSLEDLHLQFKGKKVKVMEVEEGSLSTGMYLQDIDTDGGESFLRKGILKLVVKDRYKDQFLSCAFVKGFGEMRGAIASTIAHDSHNIIAVGSSDEDIMKAMNLVIEKKGGISFVHQTFSLILPLPVGGLMSDMSADDVASFYESILKATHEHGCTLKSPLMTLSFLALLVIPSLKLSDKGLFDVNTFSFTDLFVD